MTTLLLTVLLAQSPADATPHLNAAGAALDAGDSATAASELTIALEIDADNVDALEAAAMLALSGGDSEKAIEHLERLLRLDPNNDRARLLLARAEWLAGDETQADETLALLLARHPSWAEGLALQSSVEGGAGAPRRGWKSQARAGMGLTYDSNLTLDSNGSLANADEAAALMAVDLATTLSRDQGAWPFIAIAQVSSQAVLFKQRELGALAPSEVGLGLILRHRYRSLVSALDLRYQEIFTDLFAIHQQRRLSPSLWAAHPLGQAQRLRLLGGVELRQAGSSTKAASSVTAKATLRDTIQLGRATVVVDLGVRRNDNYDAGSPPASVLFTESRTDFSEVTGSLFGTYDLTEDTSLFLLGEGAGRKYQSNLRESTYRGFVGCRKMVGAIELHAEYGYARNLSHPASSYIRHQLTAGVRAWFE